MSGLGRSRWAAIGAAVAVSLGAGGLGLTAASSGVESSFVSVAPARVLDTRTGLGLTGPLVSPTPRALQITGGVARPDGSSAVVVPSGASAVVLNVTAVGPDADGFVSVRPDGTPGAPETSNLNFSAGAIVPNAVTVALPASGAIELTYDAFGAVGPTTDVLVDVTGFYTPTSGGGGATGPVGPQGPAGPKGDKGVPGVDPARVVWVAAGGDGTFSSLSAALASITGNSASTPYVVKIAPGAYTETGPVAMKDFVDVEGSGEGVTTLTCACGGAQPGGFVTAGNITAEVRHLTIENTGGGEWVSAVATDDVVDGRFSLLHVTANGTAGDNTRGVSNDASSPAMNHVTATATGSGLNYAVHNSSSSPVMNHVVATATGGTRSRGVHNQTSSAPVMNDLTATGTSSSGTNYGVYSGISASRSIIRNSAIQGDDQSVYSYFGLTDIAGTTLDGSVSGPGFRCVGVHDRNFAPLLADCT